MILLSMNDKNYVFLWVLLVVRKAVYGPYVILLKL